ncbi:MAG: hypothetical protein ACXIT4_01480 [Erythrobacter sp.]
MQRERRALAVVRLQAMLAAHCKREAMRGLADALADHSRKTSIADRTQALLDTASPRSGMVRADELAARARFGAGLGRISADARTARDDAARQAEWQARMLAAAEARVNRIRELESAARLRLESTRERRDGAISERLARKLQR